VVASRRIAALLSLLAFAGLPKVPALAGQQHIIGAAPTAHASTSPTRDEEAVRQAYGHLPAVFEPNVGQADSDVLYLSRSGGGTLALGQSGATLLVAQPQATASPLALPHRPIRSTPRVIESLHMAFVGARADATLQPLDRLPGRINYLLGSDPALWHTNVSTYGTVSYRGLYDGIDLGFSGNDGRLEYTYTVAPGGDPSKIRLAFSGQSAIRVDGSGNLVLHVGSRDITQAQPVIYQDVAGRRRAIPGGYRLLGGGAVAFSVGSYDRSRPLVIDPVLSYSTYLGGSLDDIPVGIAVDDQGEAFVAGLTDSTNFPTASQGLQGGYDVFVTKLNPAGSATVYSTYIGGSKDDNGEAIVVDASGQAYITGVTDSTNFPTTSGAFQPAFTGGAWDVFVSRLSAAGDSLGYSTYLGGGKDDEGFGITLDATGAYPIVTGTTSSAAFPVTAGAFHRTNAGGYDAFVTKVNPNPNQALAYSTYLGGAGTDEGFGIALNDTYSNVAVTGVTTSNNFPIIAGAFQSTYKGGIDAFLTEVTRLGKGLVYSTYLGGAGDDEGSGVAVSAPGYAYVTGLTKSTNFPHTSGAYQTTNKGDYDEFITKVNESASQPLPFSTYLGGTKTDYGLSLALDSSGNVHIAGSTNSTAFPTGGSPVDSTFGGVADVVVSELSPTGSALLSSTYLGGKQDDESRFIALDSSGNDYVTGFTNSLEFPTAGNPLFTYPAGGGSPPPYDAFVAKLASGSAHQVTITDSDMSPKSVTTTPGGTVQWNFSPSNLYYESVSDSSGLGLFDSNDRPADSSYSFTYYAAGKYKTYDGFSYGSVVVKPTASPKQGDPTTRFAVHWASSSPPGGFVFDVQIQRPTDPAFEDWKPATKSRGASFSPDVGDGTYSFRARLRNTGDGASSGYSPAASVSVVGIAVTDSGFVPLKSTSDLGQSTEWVFPATNSQNHSATDDSGFGLFDSGLSAPGSSFSYSFVAAGTYPIIDTATSHTSTVYIPVDISPVSYPATSFVIKWATAAPPSGQVFDVQIENPGSGSFVDWKKGTTLTSAKYRADPLTEGLYRFRARIRDQSSGSATQWSPPRAAGVAAWHQYLKEADHSSSNPLELWLNPSIISSVIQAWKKPLEAHSQPAVVGNVLYVSTASGHLAAVNATTGTQLWSGSYIPNPRSPAVVGSTVYVSSDNDGVYAFDAAGNTNCSGTPKTCEPIWQAPIPKGSMSPVVANGVVYALSWDIPNTVYAFDASGSTACSGTPKICQPLWTIPSNEYGFTSIATSGPFLFATALDGIMRAFDAAGTTNCSGTPKTCQAVWTASTGGNVNSGPIVSGGKVFVADANGVIRAFDAAGMAQCSGSPKVCQPLWASPPGDISAIAAGGGVVYGVSISGDLRATDASTGATIWSEPAPDNGTWDVPIIAGGLLFLNSSKLVAVDAASGQVLWTGRRGSFPSVVNGVIFQGDGTYLRAYHL
jgi:outer membrane protein assembly factor BamB/plastocyanin